MTDMVERVAITLSMMDDDERPLPSAWAGRMADYYRMLARAALADMREPTEAMSDAGLDLGPDRHHDDYWRAMIDAALAGAPTARPSLGTGSTER